MCSPGNILQQTPHQHVPSGLGSSMMFHRLQVIAKIKTCSQQFAWDGSLKAFQFAGLVGKLSRHRTFGAVVRSQKDWDKADSQRSGTIRLQYWSVSWPSEVGSEYALKGMVRLHQWFVSLLTAGFTKNVLFKLDIVCPRLLRVWWAPKRCALQITLARNRVWVTWQADCWFQVCLGYCWNVDAYIAHGLQEERREPELTGKYNWRLRSNRKKTIETREMFPFALFCSVFAPLLRLDRIHKFHFQRIKWI